MASLQIKPAAVLPAEGSQTFSISLFDDFVNWIDRSKKTTNSYLKNLRQFAAWMLYADVAQPMRKDIILYRSFLESEHYAIMIDKESVNGWSYRVDRTGNRVKVICKPNTIKSYLGSVRQFFKWTAASGLYPDIAANIHAPKVRNDTHKKDALTAAEVLQIENSIIDRSQNGARENALSAKDPFGKVKRGTEQGKRLYAMFLLATNAGLRTVEISRANIKDLETKNGLSWLYIWGKGHAEPDQKKPLAPEVAEAIRDYLQIRTDNPTRESPLFVATGNRSGGKRLAPTTISTMLKKAMQAAGFDSERITAHSLRHTTGTAVQELTGDIYTTQKYMRHSNPATTEIYLHNDTAQREAVIARQVYNLFHGIETTDSREKLEEITGRLSAQQVEQLTAIAAAML